MKKFKLEIMLNVIAINEYFMSIDGEHFCVWHAKLSWKSQTFCILGTTSFAELVPPKTCPLDTPRTGVGKSITQHSVVIGIGKRSHKCVTSRMRDHINCLLKAIACYTIFNV